MSEVPIAESGTPLAGSRPMRVGYLARQPILDRRGGVFGYELRYHLPADAPADATLIGAHGIVDALALFGVERFAGGQWAFIRCSAQMLMEEMFEALPPSSMVLEFPSCPEAAPKLLRACRRLKKAGFRLALTEFDPGSDRDPLIDHVDYVKVDAKYLDSQEWKSFCRHPDSGATILIADNIQTHDSYRAARAAGLRYFQGFYFSSPDLIPNGSIPANRLQHLEILRELFKDPLDLKSIGPLVERDASLVYRVLRFVNSPICAIRQPVTSIEMAIVLLGDAIFRRIATLAIQCGLNHDQSPELLNMALVRARFCAAAARLCGIEPNEQYLLGMLSMLPPMLGVPMEQILPGLPLREPIQDALAGVSVRERCLLSWMEELEHDRVAECDAIAARWGLDKDELARLYVDALDTGNRIAAEARATG